MEKEFVTYEQGLALKELGFNEYCLIKDTEQGEDCAIYYVHDNGTPTFSQVFRWFREKYNIQGYIYSTTVRGNKEGKNFSDYCWNINGIDMGFIRTDPRDMEYITHEEAESACIDKLIEIVKNK